MATGAPGLIPVCHLLARDRARLFACVDFFHALSFALLCVPARADSLICQPREALLKYAERAEQDPQWTAGALTDPG